MPVDGDEKQKQTSGDERDEVEDQLQTKNSAKTETDGNRKPEVGLMTSLTWLYQHAVSC